MPEDDEKAPPKGPQASSYAAKDITVLEGLDPVRKRPGMFIGSTGPSGIHHLLEFAKGGRMQGKLQVTGKSPRGRRGTTVTFWPDPGVFEDTEFRAQTVLERLQMMAFLNKGLEIRFADERPAHEQAVTYLYAGGIVDFVRHLNESKEALFKRVSSFEATEDDQEIEIALQWNTGYYEA